VGPDQVQSATTTANTIALETMGSTDPKKEKRSRRATGSELTVKPLALEEKLAQYLNEALSVENAAVSRLQSRIKEVQLEDARRQLQRHLEETREQQNRLKQLITTLAATPTNGSAELPIFLAPKSVANTLAKAMTSAEQQIKSAKEDFLTMKICLQIDYES
jgi:Domain of unknown function (DUF892)